MGRCPCYDSNDSIDARSWRTNCCNGVWLGSNHATQSLSIRFASFLFKKTKLSKALSKWAVEALAEALRLELYQNNIKVSILEPGNYLGGTQILNEERVRQLTDK